MIAAWRLMTRTARRRGVIQASADASAGVVGLAFATYGRYDFNFSGINERGVAGVIAAAVVLQLIVGWGCGLYRGRWRIGSFDEVSAVANSAIVTTAAVVGVELLTGYRIV